MLQRKASSRIGTRTHSINSSNTSMYSNVILDDPYLMNANETNLSLKESWVRNQLKDRASEYKQTRKLSVVVGTWNVNQKLPKADTSMEEYLHLDLDPDIIAVGLQEIDMTAQAMIKQETEAATDWISALDSEIFGAKSKYMRVSMK